MAIHAERLLTHIELAPAALDQESVLADLLELYAHDFSEFHEIELGVDGRFGYKPLPLYWPEPNRRPFLIRVDGKLAGLVLVKKGQNCPATRPSGTRQNSLFYVATGGVELEPTWHTKSGGRCRAYGKFASCSRIIRLISSGRMPSRHSLERQSSQFVSKTVANYGAYSHLNRSLFRSNAGSGASSRLGPQSPKPGKVLYNICSCPSHRVSQMASLGYCARGRRCCGQVQERNPPISLAQIMIYASLTLARQKRDKC